MKTEILVYKFEIQSDFFILNVPKNLVDLGYDTECYGSDSRLFEESDDFLLEGEEKGVYKLSCETIDSKLSFKDVKKTVETELKWPRFEVKEIVKVPIK